MENTSQRLKLLSVFAKFTSKAVSRPELQQVNITASGIEACDSYQLLKLCEPQDEPKPVEGFPDTAPIFESMNKAKTVSVRLDPKFVINMMRAFSQLEKNKGVTITLSLDETKRPVKFTAEASNLVGLIMPLI